MKLLFVHLIMNQVHCTLCTVCIIEFFLHTYIVVKCNISLSEATYGTYIQYTPGEAGLEQPQIPQYKIAGIVLPHWDLYGTRCLSISTFLLDKKSGLEIFSFVQNRSY